jgi:hypothetical protein
MTDSNIEVAGTEDDIILMSGLTLAEDRAMRAFYASRAEQSKRERLTLAARWALENGGEAVAMDSKGWPLDAVDWPLRPPPHAMAETMRAYRHAITMAKSRRTRRGAARRAAVQTFDIAKLDLSDIRAPARAMCR